MNTCKTCKHWKSLVSPVTGPSWSGGELTVIPKLKDYDEVKGVADHSTVGECMLAANAYDGETLADGRLMLAGDYEGYRAFLYTRAEFGCVCWEGAT